MYIYFYFYLFICPFTYKWDSFFQRKDGQVIVIHKFQVFQYNKQYGFVFSIDPTPLQYHPIRLRFQSQCYGKGGGM